MIITIPAEKDTYVSNIKGTTYNASLANVGHAATLDLFKLHNENKNSYSWALFEFSGVLSDSSILILEDSNNTKVLFFIDENIVSNSDGVGGLEFGTAQDTKDIASGNFIIGQEYKITSVGNTIFTNIGSLDNNIGTVFTATSSGTGNGTAVIENAVIVGISGKVQSDYSLLFKNIITSINNFNNGLTLNINAYNNSGNQLLLKQNKSGDTGDTLVRLPNNMNSSITTDVGGTVFGKFARIDFSAILIKFDLQDFKNKYMNNVDFANSSFDNLSAEIVIRDVTSGHTKPKDYSLEIFSLNKSFEEGTGKDTIHFSDTGIFSNFVSLSSLNNWQIPEFISENDDVTQVLNSSQNISKGNEDLRFDVTSYIKTTLSNAVQNNLDVSDNGFLIKFADSNLFDKKSYFVKRVGSKHLVNKTLSPVLQVKIPDHEKQIPKKTFVVKRYLNNEESFYLYNIVSGKLKQFILPDNDVNNPTEIKFKIISKDKADTFLDNVSSLDVTNYKGKVIEGIKIANITNTQLSKFDNTVLSSGKTIKDHIINNELDCFIVWYSIEDQEINVILEEESTFNTSEHINDNTFKNLLSKIKIENFDLTANGCITECSVYFIDTRASHDPVKLPFDLPSENIGDIQYQIVNNDTGKIILDFEDNTEAFYDGEKYVFNVCFPEIYKNFNIRFNFKILDEITGNSVILYNKNVFRIQ